MSGDVFEFQVSKIQTCAEAMMYERIACPPVSLVWIEVASREDAKTQKKMKNLKNLIGAPSGGCWTE